jgi:hypothetical protein
MDESGWGRKLVFSDNIFIFFFNLLQYVGLMNATEPFHSTTGTLRSTFIFLVLKCVLMFVKPDALVSDSVKAHTASSASLSRALIQ